VIKIKDIFFICFFFTSTITLAENKVYETKDSHIQMSGKFKIDNFLPSLTFKLVGSDGKFGLEIYYVEEKQKQSCLYKVTRLTSPQQTKAISGVIYARMMKTLPCNYQITDKKLQSILNDTRLINIRYQLEPDNTISGNIELQGLQHRQNSSF